MRRIVCSALGLLLLLTAAPSANAFWWHCHKKPVVHCGDASRTGKTDAQKSSAAGTEAVKSGDTAAAKTAAAVTGLGDPNAAQLQEESRYWKAYLGLGKDQAGDFRKDLQKAFDSGTTVGNKPKPPIRDRLVGAYQLVSEAIAQGEFEEEAPGAPTAKVRIITPKDVERALGYYRRPAASLRDLRPVQDAVLKYVTSKAEITLTDTAALTPLQRQTVAKLFAEAANELSQVK